MTLRDLTREQRRELLAAWDRMVACRETGHCSGIGGCVTKWFRAANYFPAMNDLRGPTSVALGH